jgi:phosphotriesterase-related protein
MTVLGPVSPDDLGITLMHEHLLVDATSWWHPPSDPRNRPLVDAPVSCEIYGELRMDPFMNKDNCLLNDPEIAISEVRQFAELGGRTLVDPTCRGIGRNPKGLQRIARRTGLNIVMGTGYYLESSHPPEVHRMSIQDLAESIARDVQEGSDGVRAGIIGEIGVSASFTAMEEKVLRAAARAQKMTKVPLSIHLPGWERYGHRVLDVIGEEGVLPQAVVLCHMNPSGDDPEYQMSLADRGAYLEYDMIGMDYFYADQGVQCPCDEENARAVKRLVESGYAERILLSQDVFLKMMLTRNGGFGYGYILKHFVPRLRRHGLSEEQIHCLLVGNPCRLFLGAAE